MSIARPKAQPKDRDMLVIGPGRPNERNLIGRPYYWDEVPMCFKNEGPFSSYRWDPPNHNALISLIAFTPNVTDEHLRSLILTPEVNRGENPSNSLPFQTQNSQFAYGSNFQTIPPHFGNQQTPTTNQNSPHSQSSFIDATNVIDLNDDVNEFDDTQKDITQWCWNENQLLISAWLNVSTDPLIGADQKGEAFWDRIQKYHEVSNLGLIKRGVVAIKKR
ncbi:uncharacterized protein LOC141712344 [Apium graveolens]|uniref:uncharacterized protein LOC141712344 n=1 Tax=Apium graveolens TaxID=4045 RepID=UPI003D7B8C7D